MEITVHPVYHPEDGSTSYLLWKNGYQHVALEEATYERLSVEHIEHFLVVLENVFRKERVAVYEFYGRFEFITDGSEAGVRNRKGER